jgi:hypothetical protein
MCADRIKYPAKRSIEIGFPGDRCTRVNFRRIQTHAPISLAGSCYPREIVDTLNFGRPEHFTAMMFPVLAILI